MLLGLVPDVAATLRFVQMSSRLDWLSTHNELVRRTLTAEALVHLKARDDLIEGVEFHGVVLKLVGRSCGFA